MHLGLLDNHANQNVFGLAMVIPHNVVAEPFHQDRAASMCITSSALIKTSFRHFE
ncbi:hypothetical protein ACIRG5_30235 [Lentzea sp. NPDC102401]|uniref:hypothetical protein n=1 Tax=Lentzea sp. NPDC102401 TaxID=3364128 RepID=UPI00380D6C83